jgi:ABC-2 type transport system ATP-binding protein
VPDAIRTERLTKCYGKTPGILDLDLQVRTGEVFGFLGPNGAGKSTTIRTLLGLLHATSGRASILGLDHREHSIEIRRRTGHVPADLALYPDMTGRQLLGFLGALRGFDDTARMGRVADRLSLDLDRRVGSYSSGNRRKLGIAQAFMHEPELLILDEPTTGLDPLAQQEFFAMVDEVREQGRTVFLSSHVLPEVERLADRVAIVRQSRLVVVEEVEALKRKARRKVEIRFAGPVDPAEFAAAAGVQTASAIGDGHGVQLEVEGPLTEVFRVASRHEVRDFASREADLEEVFLAYYGGDAS